MKLRRGGTLALVLCLYLALAAILGGAITLAATSNSAAERDYCRSQALALAEAAVAEARSGLSPHAEQPLGDGSYSWTAVSQGVERLVTARGAVTSASGARITRTVRARLAGGKIRGWEEGP